MCGRFAIHKTIAELVKLYQATVASGAQFPGSFNVAPTESVPMVTNTDAGNHIDLARFGMAMKTGTKTFPLLNLQSEKVSTRKDFLTSRCIIPATGFFEWVAEEGGKQPYYFTAANDEVFSFAGIWRKEEQGGSFSILTTAANDLISPIHNRMPVILTGNVMGEWLAQGAKKETLESLMTPYPANLMRVWKVSKTVNNPRNKEATCINSL